jgi:hypothetical protein
MRHTNAAVLIATAAAALSFAPRSVAAQQLTAAATASVRTVATYDFRNGPRESAFLRTVTVADSAGTLVAKADFAAGGSTPLTVEAIQSDLVLQAETPEGTLTLVLERQADGDAALVSGKWYLGRREGQLRGRLQQ